MSGLLEKINASWVAAIMSVLMFIGMTLTYFAGGFASREDMAALRLAVAADHEEIIGLKADLKYVVQGIADLRNAKIIETTPKR